MNGSSVNTNQTVQFPTLSSNWRGTCGEFESIWQTMPSESMCDNFRAHIESVCCLPATKK